MKETVLTVIFFSFLFGGIFASKREKRKLELLSELEKLVLYMGSQIDLYRRELIDIYCSFESELLDKAGFSEKLGEIGFEGAVRHLDLDLESKRVLCELGSTLGMLSASEQKASIDRCSTALALNLDKARSEYPKKRKLYISFGLMLGAVIFIVGI